LENVRDQAPLHDGHYAFYIVEVPHIPAQKIARRYKFRSLFLRDYAERKNYAWIPWKLLRPIIESTDEPVEILSPIPPLTHSPILWDAWLHNMREALETNRISWEQTSESEFH